MATTLAPVDSREVVRCDQCHLVQFRTNNNLCRKCKLSLDEEPEPVAMQPVIEPQPTSSHSTHLPVALAIRSLRLRAGLSQRQLALRMRVPRTYVSKIENEKACPTLSSLERLANALHVSVPDLLKGDAHNLQDDIRELQSDEFIAELIDLLPKLSPMDCATIMARVRDMSIMPRRTA
ncbi:MAG TPA: helix-turn-helix transcriptional regulator [Clostridia bacterium]|nr:helix-turn-helix transcriptional regulator [Clostridia bacterium]